MVASPNAGSATGTVPSPRAPVFDPRPSRRRASLPRRRLRNGATPHRPAPAPTVEPERAEGREDVVEETRRAAGKVENIVDAGPAAAAAAAGPRRDVRARETTRARPRRRRQVANRRRRRRCPTTTPATTPATIPMRRRVPDSDAPVSAAVSVSAAEIALAAASPAAAVVVAAAAARARDIMRSMVTLTGSTRGRPKSRHSTMATASAGMPLSTASDRR